MIQLTDEEKLRELIVEALSECPLGNIGYDGMAQHILNKLKVANLVVWGVHNDTTE